jgi:hypothetical protein
MLIAISVVVAFLLPLWLIRRGADPLWTWLASCMVGPMGLLLTNLLSAGGDEGIRFVALLLPALWTAVAGGAGALIGLRLRKQQTGT